MNHIVRTVGLVALVSFLSGPAWGLGLGDISMRSFLNEPLRADIALLDAAALNPEDIHIKLATQGDFDRLGVERSYFLTSLQFTVEIDQSGAGQIVITTAQPLLEPYLDFIVEARWPSGRLLREYTVLVDLPSQSGARLEASGLSGPGPERSVDPEPNVTPSEPNKTLADQRYDGNASERPAAGDQYLVRRRDTLWAIADAARPAGTSVEQMMLATVDLNPEAFVAGNINGLKAGYVLELPTDGDIRASQRQARAEVSLQNDDWRSGIRRAPALRVVADAPDPDDGIDSGKKTAVNKLADPVADQINTFSGGADVYDEDAGAGGGDTQMMALQGQLGVLSDQINNLREMVSIKDAQIAELQSRLAAMESAEARSDRPNSGVSMAAAQPGTPSMNADIQPADQSITGDKVALAASEPVSDLTAQPPEKGFLGFAWWMWAVLGLVFAAGLGVLTMRRMKGEDKEEDGLAPSPSSVMTSASIDLNPSPVSTGTASNKSPDRRSDIPSQPVSDMEEGGERGYGKRLHNEYAAENPLSDAIAEADIYIAYGRYQQALDLLQTALDNDPSNSSGYLKMLDIYLKTDRVDEAWNLLARIRETGDDDALAQAESRMAERSSLGSSQGVDLGDLADHVGEYVAERPVQSSTLSTDDTLPDLSFDLDDSVEPDTSEGTGELTLEPETDELSGIVQVTDPGPQGDLGNMNGGEFESGVTDVLNDDTMPVVDDGSGGPDNTTNDPDKSDPIETKLDLARAYLDMGDDDGARPVLEEVLASGSLEQQAAARELLLSID